MDVILDQSVITLTKADANQIARQRHPIAVKVLCITAIGLLIGGRGDRELTLVWLAAMIWALGSTVYVMYKIRAATSGGLLQGADEIEIRHAVTDKRIIIEQGPVSLSREWDSIVSTRIDRGILLLIAVGGQIAIPLAYAPAGLVEAVSEQLRRRQVPDPPEPPALRRTFVVLLVLLAAIALFLVFVDDPIDICDENPGLTYWDGSGPHTC